MEESELWSSRFAQENTMPGPYVFIIPQIEDCAIVPELYRLLWTNMFDNSPALG